MTTSPQNKSIIYIREGVGCINHEPITTHVVVEDHSYDTGSDSYTMHVRQMLIDCGNGYRVSVVFGFGTHSDNKYTDMMSPNPDGNPRIFKEEVTRAEIAIVHDVNGLIAPFEDEWGEDSVKGYCDAQEILYWVQRTRTYAREHAEAPISERKRWEPLVNQALKDIGSGLTFFGESKNE